MLFLVKFYPPFIKIYLLNIYNISIYYSIKHSANMVTYINIKITTEGVINKQYINDLGLND